MSTVETTTEIRPFHIEIPEEQLDDLRRRIAATRWPSKELVPDRSQGVQLATIRALADYWANEYDFGRVEARLNALPQFTTQIDGVDIHFIHVKSRHENALPLIMTHGWPGSVIELLETSGPLTDPTAHGGQAEDAFHLVLPSLPGYGFSGEPREIGWDPSRIGRGVGGAHEPPRLHPLRRPGRRRGRARYRRDGPAGARGAARHPHQPARGGARSRRSAPRGRRAGARRRSARSPPSGRPASATTWSRRRGRRRSASSLLDSPVGLAAWLLDHDTDSYQKISHAFVDGEPTGNLTRDTIVDNITLYWLTGTGASAARAYWEGGRAQAQAAGQPPPEITLPVGFTTFPGEVFAAPAQLGRSGLSQPHLLQRGRQGRALRRLGRAGALLRRDASCVQVTALIGGR